MKEDAFRIQRTKLLEEVSWKYNKEKQKTKMKLFIKMIINIVKKTNKPKTNKQTKNKQIK